MPPAFLATPKLTTNAMLYLTSIFTLAQRFIFISPSLDKVPGLPQRFDFWSSNELCSVAKGNLFHVETRAQWDSLNTFLVGLGTSHSC